MFCKNSASLEAVSHPTTWGWRRCSYFLPQPLCRGVHQIIKHRGPAAACRTGAGALPPPPRPLATAGEGAGRGGSENSVSTDCFAQDQSCFFVLEIKPTS